VFEDGMDLSLVVFGVAAANLSVLGAGCALAMLRTWRERHPRRRTARTGSSLGSVVDPLSVSRTTN
jgi:hypothetical protein